jgi:uncharacterized protein involved in exopolysaccharide biosynthesis
MNIDFTFFIKLFWRRLPVMSVFIILCSGLGAITAMKLPETFQTSARLLVEAPQIPDSMVATTIQTEATEQLDIIEQKLLTRANMIDIAQKFSVYENMRTMEPDTVVSNMRANTRIRRSAGRDRATLMTISFEGRTAQIVANVVNEYVTLVLAENQDFRISRAERTLDFFEEEVNRLAADLDKASSEIAIFKSENANALPEEQSFRLARQSTLSERIARLEREISAVNDQRENTKKLFEATGRVGTTDDTPKSPEQARLDAARNELEIAKATYSDTNPRMIRLRAEIERLEVIVTQQLEAADPTGDEIESQVSAQEAVFEAQIANLDARMSFLEDDIETNRKELDDLKLSIAQSSANGIQLNALERDFEIIQTRYNQAVSNLNQARMSERIETTAQGQRITVIENANVPRVPAGPDRVKIGALGAAAGVGLAAAYFMLLELLNRTVRRPAELIGRFNITPITTIPYMESRSRRFARRAGLITATLAVLIGIPVGLYLVDTYYLPLDVFVQKGLAELGLS